MPKLCLFLLISLCLHVFFLLFLSRLVFCRDVRTQKRRVDLLFVYFWITSIYLKMPFAFTLMPLYLFAADVDDVFFMDCFTKSVHAFWHFATSQEWMYFTSWNKLMLMSCTSTCHLLFVRFVRCACGILGKQHSLFLRWCVQSQLCFRKLGFKAAAVWIRSGLMVTLNRVLYWLPSGLM